MADVRRIVTISPTGTVTSLVDFEGTNYASERDTFTVTPPSVTPILSQAQRQYGGAKTVGQIHANGSISLVLLVTGSSFDNAMLNVSSTLQVLLTPRTDLYFEWRPQGVTNSVYYQIVGPPQYSSTYSWIQWQGTKRLPIKLEIPVAPLARGPVTTYSGSSGFPDVLQLPSVPGDAPALVDMQLQCTGGSDAPIWALFGWWKKPLPFNTVLNGGFELNTQGWATSGLIFNAAPTSVARITSAFKYGTASMQVVASTSANSGPEFTVFRPFRAGQVYTLKAWVHANSGADTVQLIVGQSGGAHFATGTATATSTTWTELSVAWTPDVDMAYAIIGIRHVAASAFTFEVDGVRLYEGATEPTLGSDGMGAHAPLGVIQAEYASSITGALAVTANVSLFGGYGLQASSLSGAGSTSATWNIDPSVVAQDDFANGVVDIEVFARVRASAQTPTFTASIAPASGFGSPTYTNEYGSAGKLVKSTASANGYMSRLGTITMSVDPFTPILWNLKIAAAWGPATSAGGITIDYIVLVPSRARAVSKSGVSPDAYYPKFIPTTASTLKTIYGKDLSGSIGPAGANQGRDSGLGGSLMEIPPGNVEFLVKLSSAVCDDPSTTAVEPTITHSGLWTARVTPRYFLVKGA